MASDQVPDASYSVLVPSGADVSVRVGASAFNPNGSSIVYGVLSGVVPGTGPATLTLPAPALPRLPLPGATSVDTNTSFAWSAFSGGIHVVLFTGSGSTSAPSFAVVTAEASTHIPDLASQGLALPPGQFYDWVVIGFAPLASVDAVAGTGTIAPTGASTFQSVAESTFRAE